MFELHPVLKKDTILVKDLQFCQLLLMNNAFYPWFILVPKKANLTEIIDLNVEEQNLLMAEISLVSRIIKKIFSPDKLNVAALGNMVPQLHIHIIARYKNDITFPKPVWAGDESKIYSKEQSDEIIDKVLSNLV